MASVGRSDLLIVPKIEGGLANYINGEISKANVAGAGRSAGSSFMGGFASGASIGTWSAIASKAIGAVTSSLGAAASRVDTLSNYPRIMQSLGVETDVANRSIETMSDALQNVPTRLDDMAATVQGLYAATSRYGTSLDTVTDAGLALNAMLLAGGSSQQVVNAAMEQFRQMVSKGKPELQDWKSLISAAPGQMNQLAKEMLGATATAEDLYAALGGGREADYAGAFEWGSLGMDEFVERFAGLRETFEGAAEDAQGGIQTAFANMQNAVTRGVAGVLESFGQGRIAGALNDLKGVVNAAFKGIQGVAAEVAPSVSRAWDAIVSGVRDALTGLAPVASAVSVAIRGIAAAIGALSPAIPAVVGVTTAMSALRGISGGLGGLLGGVSEALLKVAASADGVGLSKLAEGFFSASSGASGLASVLTGPWGVAIAAAATGIGLYAAKQLDARRRSEEFQATLTSVSSVAESANAALLGGARAVEGYGSAHQAARADIDGLMESLQEYRERVTSIQDGAAEQIGLLGQYKTVIDEMAGAGEVSAEKMGLLEWALDGLAEVTGRSYDAQQVLTGSYVDEAGAVHDLKAEIDELIASKQEEARQDALKEIYTETYKAQQEAAVQLALAERDYYQSHDKWVSDYIAAGGSQAAAEQVWRACNEDLTESLQQAQSAYRTTSTELDQVASMWAGAAEAAGTADSAYMGWVNSSPLVSASIAKNVGDLGTFAAALEGAGVSAEELTSISEIEFSEMAASCGGSLDALVAAVAERTSKAKADASTNSAQMREEVGRNAKSMTDTSLGHFANLVQNTAQRFESMRSTVAGKSEAAGSAASAAFQAMGSQVSVTTAGMAGAVSSNMEGAKVSATSKADAANAGVSSSFGGMVANVAASMAALAGSVESQGAAAAGSATEKSSAIERAWNRTYDMYINAQANTWDAESRLNGLLSNVFDRTMTITTIQRTVHETFSAASSWFGFAHGGHIVPRHAAGYIAAGPTRTNFGWVGEDGIEAVYNNPDGSSDVYPLNNPRYLGYADPLAERIAEAITPKVGARGVDIHDCTFNVRREGDVRRVAEELDALIAHRQAGGLA